MRNLCLLIAYFMVFEVHGQIANSAKQSANPWLNEPGYVAYMWPSFIQLRNTTTTVDLTSSKIIGSDHAPGLINLVQYSISRKEAFTAVLCLIGGGSDYEIKKYGIAKDKPNIIPYKDGIIVYGYWKENNQWELFNVNASSIIEHSSYRCFDIMRK